VTSARRYNEVQLSDEAFDRPACPVRAKVFICATGRTGSWLLCRAMIHHGIGVPHEYFNASHIGVIGPRFGIQALADGRRLGSDAEARRAYIAGLMERRTVNGIFAAKMHWGQYASYLENAEGTEMLQQGHFIHLYRENLLAQAISFHLSKETGRWGFDDTVTTPPASEPSFLNVKLIDDHMKSLAEADMNWRLFFARNAIAPLAFSYERIKGDLGGVLSDIVGSFGLEVPAGRFDYKEEAPDDVRDAQVPPRTEITTRFLLAHQRVTAAPGSLRTGRGAAAEVRATGTSLPAPGKGSRDSGRNPHAASGEQAVGQDARVVRARPGQKICLCMIVKDEVQVIARCLGSVRPIIDHWIIVDTGSTDGTQEEIRECLSDIPGELHERPWVDFAYNRTEAFNLARAHGDYSLFIDADDVLELLQSFTMPKLRTDSYLVEIRNKDRRHWRPQLVRNDIPWRYEGVLHEFLSSVDKKGRRVLAEERSQERLPGALIRVSEEGARRRVAADKRFARDAATLESALKIETDPLLVSRYRFYLGQSYRDAGDKQKALEAYLARAKLGFWDQEIFTSLYWAGILQADLGFGDEVVIETFLSAHAVCKNRAEALHGASRFCRNRQRFQQGFDFAERGLKIKRPDSGLFIEEWIYDYGLLDELAVNAYWIGRYQDCLDACERLLREGKMPENMRDRVTKNAEFAAQKIREPASAPPKQSLSAAVEPPEGKNAGPKKLGLCMIVKNESRVILRCLESVRPLVDYVLIEDTGSTDGTQDMIRQWLDRAGLPGEVFDEPWRDFAYNRSHALAKLREVKDVDYALILDADDQLFRDDGFDVAAFKKGLSQDLYRVEQRQGSIRYQTGQICRNSLEFRYRGVLHEFLEGPASGFSSGVASGFHILSGREGARSQDPDKYRKDARVLEQALTEETDTFLRSRYTFYLGQSYRDAGEKEKALDSYLKRAELGYWAEEIFESLFNAAQLMQALGRPFEEVVAMHLRASEAAPGRAESLHAASRLCREKNKFAEGYEYAKRGLAIALPANGLFVQSWIYDYGLLDEFAVNAYWIGRYQDCLDACTRLLREEKMPQAMRERVTKNAEFAAEKIRLASSSPEPAAKPPAGIESAWIPMAPLGGTELMVQGLRERMGEELGRVNLQLNHPGHDKADGRPRVVWMHHDVDQRWVQWCKDKALVDSVSRFVFVSYWQRDRYLNAFGLPPERCAVLRHALDLDADPRRWDAAPTWRCTYTSTPFRGLSVLLDAWQRLSPANAELHIWSSMKLYLGDDSPYRHLYERAESMPGVVYHGLAPNAELRAALRSMHFLAYPSTFPETACLAVIEAMAAGCRVIVPSLGALPETTCGYARVYPFNPNAEEHAAVFAENLAAELAAPWLGEPELSMREQAHCTATYDWPRRLREWRELIIGACDQRPRPEAELLRKTV
jgi:glycosyltransferase involved in cell wall biosynthesis/LPS sulfotransferase NodH